MAATSLAEQLLAEIPLLKHARATSPSGNSLVSMILKWLQKGVKSPFCVLFGPKVVFLGEDFQLFEIESTETGEAENGARAHVLTPKEIFHGSELWKLPNAVDMSAVCITSTYDEEVFVLDSQLRLFAQISGQGLSRCLPSRHVAQVACGMDHVLVLTIDGEVYGSGGNDAGQLGLGHYNSVEVPEMKTVSVKGFATNVACGFGHSVVILSKGLAAFFGNCTVRSSNTPSELASPVGPPVKAVCGQRHSLLLTAEGRLAGLGKSDKSQLGELGDTDTLKEIPFESAKGRPVDIFCHYVLDASVVLTQTDELYVCGDVGALFNSKHPIPTFLRYHKPAVILAGRMVCTRPPTGSVMIPGFNEPEFCGIEVLPVLELAERLPRDSLCRLARRSVSEGVALLPSDVHDEYVDGATAEFEEVTQSSPGESVFLTLLAIQARSRYLWAMLESGLTGDISQTADGKKQLRLSKYSARVLQAYGRYLHEDVVIIDAPGAIELLELAHEYSDETGLAWQCAHAARRLVREQDLLLCLQRCIELQQLALAVDLVKLRLSVENCCDVLQVADMVSLEDAHMEYIRNIAMNFFVVHGSEVVKSARYEHMDAEIKARILTKVLKA